MNIYSTVRLEIDDERIKTILDDITKAQNTIRDGYYELEKMGVVHFTSKEAASGN